MEKFFLAALQGVNGLGGKRIRRLNNYFGSAMAVWQAGEGELRQAKILDEGVLESLLLARRGQPDLPERLQEECGRKGISLCTIEDGEYPGLLKEINNPPLVLFYRGRLAERPRLAMVGSRRVSVYGSNVA